MNFKELQLNDKILEAIAKEGYTKPSDIQSQAIPPALMGKDIIGCAQTGTGKTAAFAMPILHRLNISTKGNNVNAFRIIRALILTPTRELALQILESFRAYGRGLKLKCGVVMGGVAASMQIRTLEDGLDILVATPGRLLDLIAQKEVSLKELEIFVLDEADRMLDMGFIHDVKKIIAQLPPKRQTMFFTATMPPEVSKLAKTLLNNPVEVSVTPISSTVDLTKQSVYFTDKDKKTDLITWILKNDETQGSALVFTRTKHGADRLVQKLNRANITAMAIHGDKSQGARQNALSSFKSGNIRALVATDIAARGIDIEDLPFVINFELPNVPETYVHRIGRTGRAGKNGIAISLCDFDEKEYLADIEKLIKKKIDVIKVNPFEMSVFVKAPPKVAQARPPRKNFAPKFRA